MTYEEYRQHMRKFSRDTMACSFVQVKHPDYQALQAAGDEIVPWLFADMFDRGWHCNSCYGEGFAFPPDWVWDSEKRNWPTDTGTPCPECKGKGNISSWGCMHLLFEKTRARGDAPVVENWMRGRHDALMKLWSKWGEKQGYLPPTPDGKPDTFFGWFRGLFKRNS